MKKVICIVGPTASGKTSLSVKLASAIGAEIINTDSVSIYKKLDIGSAKITKEEMQNIPHHLIDHVDLNTEYTVYNFQQDVRNLLNKLTYQLWLVAVDYMFKVLCMIMSLNFKRIFIIQVKMK